MTPGFILIDPGADASLGGMCATRASGTNAVRYGTMRENVVGLTVVDADGDILRPFNRAKKSSAGYDLTRLFVGSEGTLGVITEVTVRLYPVPESMSAAVCCFDTLKDAIDTVSRRSSRGVARCDTGPATSADHAYSKTTLREAHSLFFEFHGSEAGALEQAETVQAIAAEHRGQDFQWATRPEDRTRLWNARHTALYAGLASRPGCRAIITDTCVVRGAMPPGAILKGTSPSKAGGGGGRGGAGAGWGVPARRPATRAWMEGGEGQGGPGEDVPGERWMRGGWKEGGRTPRCRSTSSKPRTSSPA